MEQAVATGPPRIEAPNTVLEDFTLQILRYSARGIPRMVLKIIIRIPPQNSQKDSMTRVNT